MAEKKGVGHAYNVDFLNVVFAASSLFLFLSVIWMVWDDYDREWKNTQRRFADLEYHVTQASLQTAQRSVDKGKLQQLQALQAAAEKNVTANQAKVDELQSKLKDADARIFRQQQDVNFAKANFDHDRYDFEATRAEKGAEAAQKKGEKVGEEERSLDALNLSLERTLAEKADLQKQLGVYTGQIVASQKQIEEMNTEQ